MLVLALCAFGAVVFAFGSTMVDADSAPSAAGNGTGGAPRLRSTSPITTVIFLPMVGKAPPTCPLASGSYGTVAVLSAPANPPAEINPDLNLAMRGYTPTVAYKGLVDLVGGPPSDPSAPQLYNLFTDKRVPTFSNVYQVYDWDWTNNQRGALIMTYEVTLAGFAVAPGEPVCAPGSGYDIGWAPTGYSMMVLYASPTRITLKYTREDNVVNGYTIHIENVNVDPNLLSLYQSMNSAGRARLPALFAGQPIGTAISTELGTAIRDTGSFMDPRSRGDWWHGK